MRIAAVGRGNVGGGLARRWRAAGHDVTEIGRDGGDVSDAEVVVVAVPAGRVAGGRGGWSRGRGPGGWARGAPGGGGGPAQKAGDRHDELLLGRAAAVRLARA